MESKIKVSRYIGELVKFGLFPNIEALYCLKLLLHDFSHHHIEMACNILETCGRYLYRHNESHRRTKIYMVCTIYMTMILSEFVITFTF